MGQAILSTKRCSPYCKFAGPGYAPQPLILGIVHRTCILFGFPHICCFFINHTVICGCVHQHIINTRLIPLVIDDNLIIFAHNLKNGDMFGELNRLTDASVLKANPLIDFDTLYEKGVYVPVAVLVCDINPGSAAYFDFNVSTLSTKEAFDAHIGRAKALNLVRCGAENVLGVDASARVHVQARYRELYL